MNNCAAYLARPNLVKTNLLAIAGIIAAAITLLGCADDSAAVNPQAAARTFAVDLAWPNLPPEITTGETAGVGVDSHGHVLVFHRGETHSILILEPADGSIVNSFGDGVFINAHGLAVDSEDNIWVTDTRRHQVLKFTHGGELLMSIGENGVAGLDQDHFDQPTDVAVTPAGVIFVSDGYGNSRVAKFAADGTFLMDWGEPGTATGQFNLPHGITLDPDGNVYVADRSNQRVQVFDGDGKFLKAWGQEVFGQGSRPWGLEYNGDAIYVIDGGNMDADTPDYARLSIVNLDGSLNSSWSSYGTAPGQLSWGHDVTVGADGSVYTAEVRNNNRAQRFTPSKH